MVGGDSWILVRLSCSNNRNFKESLMEKSSSMPHKYTLASLLALNLSPALFVEKISHRKLVESFWVVEWGAGAREDCMIKFMSV